MAGTLITSIEVAPAFTGGLSVTLPSMLILYSILGLGEGAITTVLVTTIQRMNPTMLNGLSLLRERKPL
jgi:ABC-type Co2+ transport system permease subunit